MATGRDGGQTRWQIIACLVSLSSTQVWGVAYWLHRSVQVVAIDEGLSGYLDCVKARFLCFTDKLKILCICYSVGIPYRMAPACLKNFGVGVKQVWHLSVPILARLFGARITADFRRVILRWNFKRMDDILKENIVRLRSIVQQSETDVYIWKISS